MCSVVGTSAIDCVERLVSKMTGYVSGVSLNSRQTTVTGAVHA